MSSQHFFKAPSLSKLLPDAIVTALLAVNTTNLTEWQWQFGATSEASEEKDQALELTPGRFCAADFLPFSL